MRVVVQRVGHASVSVPKDGYEASIGPGLLVLAAFSGDDSEEDLEWTARKLVAMRIFDDDSGVMNLSVRDVGGDVMIISQFTLYASVVKGNRPSYMKAAGPETAVPMYERFLGIVSAHLGKDAVPGTFGADMKVSLLNDGPVTILVDSKLKF